MDNAPIVMNLGLYGLRRLMPEDANSRYLKWISDPEVNAYLTVGKFPPAIEELSQYIDGFAGSSSSVAYAIVHLDGDGHVGNVTLNGINWISGTADVGLMIGEKGHAEAKCVHAVLSMLIPYAFDVLGLRRLYLGVLEGNKPYYDAAQRMNLVEEGRWRQHSLVHGQFQDEVWFGVLKKERSSLQYCNESY